MTKKLTCAVLPLALLVALALAGCQSSTSKASSSVRAVHSPTVSSSSYKGASGNTITLTSYDFTQHAITVQSSQPVVFDDLAGSHPICVGTGTGGTNTCDTAHQAPNAPALLIGPGLVLHPGDKVSITFKPGTYHIICTNHPEMYIDVTAR